MRIGPSVLLAVLVLLAGPARGQEVKPPPGDAAKGKQVYVADGCYECHGYVGQGSRATGPRLARPELSFEAFKDHLRRPSNEMPPYEESVLSEHDAADIYAFLRSLPPPPTASSIPLLSH